MITGISDYNAVTNEAASPVINDIHPRDLINVIVKGFDDFQAMPTHIIFLCLIYPIVIGFSARIYAGYDVLPLIFPLLAGYTLIGPFVATGMYELSRRREKGLDTSRKKAFHILQRHATRSIGILGAFLTVVYLSWLIVAMNIWKSKFGNITPSSIEGFFVQILSTPAGWDLIIVGSATGFIFASMVLCLSVISFPMLMDRDVSIKIAVSTSIKAVLKNPVTMILWGVIVIFALFVGAVPLFIGLSIVLPILGHSTWQLYRKVVQYN